MATPSTPDTPEDAIVERIVFARLNSQPIDVEHELRNLTADAAASVRRRIEVVARIRSLTGSADELADRPRKLGEFELEGEIARGGMGVVYRAYQPALDRHVAIKVLSRFAATDERRVQRFIREASSLAKLQHPGIVPVLSAGESDGVLYFAMPLVEGASLASILEAYAGQAPATRRMEVVRGVMAQSAPAHEIDLPDSYVEFAVRVVAETARTLAYAHEHGVLHRDVKPGNLMITPTGHVRLIDFGLVHVMGDVTQLTRTTDVLGTLPYLAPEEIDPDVVAPDPRSDVYSLGVVLYEMLAGAWPFDHVRASGVLDRIRTATPEPLGAAHLGVPKDLETICHAAIERDADRRYSGAAELAADLERFLRFEPIVASRPGLPTRCRRYLQRRPAAALTLLATALVGVLVVVLVVVDAARVSARHHATCRDYLTSTAAMSAEFERLSEASREQGRTRDFLDALVQRRHLDADERNRLATVRNAYSRGRARLDELRRQASDAERQVLAVVSSVDATLAASVRAAVARQLRVESRDAALREDSNEVENLLSRASQLQDGGAAIAGLVTNGSVRIDRMVPGQVFLFRYVPAFEIRPQEHSSRWLPVPCQRNGALLGDTEVPIGERCLVVQQAHPELGLAVGDLIVSIDGDPVSPGYFVRSAKAGSLVEQAGGQAWSRLLSVESTRVTSWADLRGAVHQGDDSLIVRLATGGREHEFTLANPAPRATVFERECGIEIATAAEMMLDAIPPRPIQLGILRDGEALDRELIAGAAPELRVVETIYPLHTVPECELHDLGQSLELQVGDYLALLREPDGDVSRYPFSVVVDSTVAIELVARPSPPPNVDVVWVSPGTLDRRIDSMAPGAGAQPAVAVSGFWCDRLETSLATWKRFLRDPLVVTEINQARTATDQLILVPRLDASTAKTFKQPMSERGAARFVDFSDVERFVAWRNAELEREGAPWRARLPTAVQWEHAAGSSSRRRFPWGAVFEPHLTSYRYTWELPIRMPVGSHPGDESVFGVRDMAGSCCEWLREPWADESGAFQTVAGGAFNYTWRDAFRSQSLSAEERRGPNSLTGVRLVYEPR